MEDAPEEEYVPLIPRPELEDELQLVDGRTLYLNRDNCTLVEHGNSYEYMDHLFIRMLGNFGVRLFGIKATPIHDYILERGYDRLLKQYPDDITVAVWQDMMKHQMEKELNGTGGELDE